MPTNDFVPFCPNDTGTNLETLGDYDADPNRTNGNQPGVASSKLNNRAIRQATAIAAALAQVMSDLTGSDVLDDGTQSELLTTLKQIIPGPTGEVTMFGGASAPLGYLLCDGTSYLRATYPALFAVIGTTFGSADGTHFNVPNFAGLFPRMPGTQSIGGISHAGPALGATQNDAFQGHWHTAGSLTATTAMSAFTDSGNHPAQGASDTSGNVGATIGGNPEDPITDGTNGTPRTGTETRPANLGVNFIIKT